MDTIRINGNISESVLSDKLKSDKNKIESYAPKFKEYLENKDKESLKKVASEFEELFVNLILKTMRSSVPKSDFFESSYQKDIYEGMMDESYAKEISNSGGFGISDMIMKSFEPYLRDEVKEPFGGNFDFKG